MIDQRSDAKFAHPVGVLDHDSLELALLERLDERGTGVEPNEPHGFWRRAGRLRGGHDGLYALGRVAAAGVQNHHENAKPTARKSPGDHELPLVRALKRGIAD